MFNFVDSSKEIKKFIIEGDYIQFKLILSFPSYVEFMSKELTFYVDDNNNLNNLYYWDKKFFASSQILNRILNKIIMLWLKYQYKDVKLKKSSCLKNIVLILLKGFKYITFY